MCQGPAIGAARIHAVPALGQQAADLYAPHVVISRARTSLRLRQQTTSGSMWTIPPGGSSPCWLMYRMTCDLPAPWWRPVLARWLQWCHILQTTHHRAGRENQPRRGDRFQRRRRQRQEYLILAHPQTVRKAARAVTGAGAPATPNLEGLPRLHIVWVICVVEKGPHVGKRADKGRVGRAVQDVCPTEGSRRGAWWVWGVRRAQRQPQTLRTACRAPC